METKEIVMNEVNDKTTASTDSIVDIPAITDTSTTTKEIVINEVNDKTTASTDSIVDIPTTTVTSATITEQLETKVENEKQEPESLHVDNEKQEPELLKVENEKQVELPEIIQQIMAPENSQQINSTTTATAKRLTLTSSFVGSVGANEIENEDHTHHTEKCCTSSNNKHRTISQKIMHAPYGCVHSLHKTKTKKPLLEIILYLLFLFSILLYSTDLGEDSQLYWYTSRIEEILAKEEWGVPIKTYMDIMEREEYWEFMNGKFYESLFDNHDDALPKNSKQRRAKLWDGNFVFHDIRFTQIRVNNYPFETETCKVPNWLKTQDTDMTSAISERGCFPVYSKAAWQKENFVPRNSTNGLLNINPNIQNCFQYSNVQNTAFTNRFPFLGLVYSNFYPR